MVNYKNGKIYKIVNDKNEIVYVGSTAEKYLSQRWAKHKYKQKDYEIVLIENYPCNCYEELRKKEQEYILKYENEILLNEKKAYQSHEEYLQRKKERYWENFSIEKNREKNNKRNIKNKIKVICDICGEEMNKSSLNRHIRRKHNVNIIKKF